MLTRATVPLGLPQAPRIPVCSLSAPAHDNILSVQILVFGSPNLTGSEHTDSDDVEWVSSNSQVETFFTGDLD